MGLEVRVRFAPSPTGFLHLGGVRTALFNWLFARHQGGKFILRIEDTDRSRSTEEYIHSILEGLSWLEIDWDEGPYRQTDRAELYQEHANRLLSEGKAYYCYCSKEELEQKKLIAQKKGQIPKYDGTCRDRKSPVPGRNPVIRFKTPQEGEIIFHDIIRGRVCVANAQLDDLVLIRSDGTPTYNFVVVVDDLTMHISHVIRGDDHLANTPRQIHIYHALGASPPYFAHLPMILGPDKTRLSKRHGAESILTYRDKGYLPEALLNYLVRLGWAYGDQEVFSKEEMIELFELEKVNKSPAVFNPEKLLWLNNYYIKTGNPERLVSLLKEQLKKRRILNNDNLLYPQTLYRIVNSLKERSKTMEEMAEAAEYFFKDDISYAPEAAQKFLQPHVSPLLEELKDRLSHLRKFSESAIQEVFSDLVSKYQIKLVNIAQPVRVALTGGTISPGIYEVISIMGRDMVLNRLQKALDYITSKSQEERAIDR
jgi:glutamyl-tRNA synthetase